MTPSWRPSQPLVLAWLALLALLAATVVLAYQPFGAWNGVIAWTIAMAKAATVAAIFMELRVRPGLVRVFAAAGFFWLAILLWLGLMDVLTRT